MHKEVIEQIFDPFYSTKFTGRGLGLSVVLGLVRAHDGAISVESQNGIGTTFKVYLPGELYVELPSPRIDESSSQLEGNEELVLLVDDESLIRNMAESLLRKRFGYSVVCASDGAEAVEIFRARGAEFSFVILDLSMPGMNGWETLNALRSLRPDIPVILTSGYDEAQLSRGEHQEKPQAFLAKPYGSEDLKRSIEACRRQTGQG
jgi:CheY-like chemotaxis protein